MHLILNVNQVRSFSPILEEFEKERIIKDSINTAGKNTERYIRLERYG